MILPAAARVERRVPAGLRRLAAVLTAAALVVGVLSGPATAVPGPRTEEAPEQAAAPLAVSIDSMTPATVPRRGTITLTGEIRNRSRSTWTDLNVYLFASAQPMTTQAEVAEATATDETLEVGARVTAPGLYDEVPDLAPGESTTYRLSVPRRELPFSGPGVYWIGVHVLGSNEDGRVDGADGRARTFVTLMPERTRAVESQGATVSLVLPLRAPVRRTQEGRVADPGRWHRRLGEHGRLGRLTALGSTGFAAPLTWVVDPAVLEAAGSLAEGNPAFDLAPTSEERSGPGGSEDSDSPLTESPAPGTGGTAEGEDPESELGELTAEAEAAGRWLDDFVRDASDQDVLVLPYGDLDMATVLRGDFGGTAENAHRLSLDATTALGLDADPVIAPLSGLLPDAALEHVDPEARVLLSERAVDSDAARVRLRQGTDAVLTNEVARVGGPAPDPPFGALALRQRILAEAAVHGLEHGPGRPLVVSLPEQWDPGAAWRSAAFFSGLSTPWLRMVPLSMAMAMSDVEEYDDPLAYTRADRREEVPVGNVLATQELAAAGNVLATLLARNDTIDEQVARAAMLGSSVHVRPRPARARARTRAISAQVHRRLTQVYVEASDLVTMSSETGNMAVTLVNDLQEPVTVGLEAHTGTDELQVRTPDLVSLGPGQRATVRLAVRSTDTGVHSVRLVPTTEDGRPLGRSTVIRVRSSQVGLVIWLIMGTGAIVFVAAIGTRIGRQVRTRKRTPGPLLKDLRP